MKRYDRAVEQCRKVVELDRGFPGIHLGLGRIYVDQGKFPEAIEELQTALKMLGPGNSYGIDILGYTYARSGKRDEALNVLNRLLALSRQGMSVSVQIAGVYAGLGEKDKAFEWLERGYGERNRFMLDLKVGHYWEGLRADARYTALLKKIGLAK
jgi:tetratricopeptide (TPR) repeat protein